MSPCTYDKNQQNLERAHISNVVTGTSLGFCRWWLILSVRIGHLHLGNPSIFIEKICLWLNRKKWGNSAGETDPIHAIYYCNTLKQQNLLNSQPTRLATEELGAQGQRGLAISDIHIDCEPFCLVLAVWITISWPFGWLETPSRLDLSFPQHLVPWWTQLSSVTFKPSKCDLPKTSPERQGKRRFLDAGFDIWKFDMFWCLSRASALGEALNEKQIQREGGACSQGRVAIRSDGQPQLSQVRIWEGFLIFKWSPQQARLIDSLLDRQTKLKRRWEAERIGGSRKRGWDAELFR